MMHLEMVEYTHRENGGTLGMVPLITNPIYTIYSGYLWGIYGISPFKELLARVKQLGYHPKGTTIFHMIYILYILPRGYGGWLGEKEANSF